MIKKLLITGLLLAGLSSAYAQDSDKPKEPTQVDPLQEDNLSNITSVLAVKVFVKTSNEDYFRIVVSPSGKISYTRTSSDSDAHFKRETVETIKGVLFQSDLHSFFKAFNKLDFSLLKAKENAPQVEPDSWIGIVCITSGEKTFSYRAETGKYDVEVKTNIENVLRATNALVDKIK